MRETLVSINHFIIPSDIGKVVNVYNGKCIVSLLLLDSMCFKYIGEFLITKKLGRQIHKVVQKKQGKMKKKK